MTRERVSPEINFIKRQSEETLKARKKTRKAF
jgi:hypothetical protein